MRDIINGNTYEKQLKKVKKYPKFNKDLLIELLSKIQAGQPLDTRYKDHSLAKHSPDKDRGCRDFHLTPNIVVVYRLTEDFVHLIAIGSHQDLGLTEGLEIKE